MSWNPRRFAVAVGANGSMRGAQMLWLTGDAIERLASASRHATLDFDNVPPFPEARLVVGFAEGMDTEAGHVIHLVHAVARSEAEGDNYDEPMHTPNMSPTPTMSALMSGASGLLGYVELMHGCVLYRSHTQRGLADEHMGATLHLNSDCNMRAVSLGAGLPEMCAINSRVGVHGCRTQHAHIDGLTPRERAVLRFFTHAAWALFHEPIEREVSATTLCPTPIRTGKGRRARDVAVSVIDVRRSSGTRSAPSGRVIEYDHRWTRRGHWRMQPCGKGRSERRRMWIDEVVCGPADKPLLQRPKVQVLR